MAELTPADAEAAELIETTYAKYGEGALSCSCCWYKEIYIVSRFIGDADHIRWVRDMIEHARTEHDAPCEVVFTPRPVTVMDATRTTDRKEHDHE